MLPAPAEAEARGIRAEGTLNNEDFLNAPAFDLVGEPPITNRQLAILAATIGKPLHDPSLHASKNYYFATEGDLEDMQVLESLGCVTYEGDNLRYKATDLGREVVQAFLARGRNRVAAKTVEVAP